MMATMLPDSLTRIRPTLDLMVQPVAPAKEVSEALSRLSAGQRVFAEVLTALPNGTYRAVVNQRDMVLSLPFSAKTGDSLELEVVRSDGRVAFAVLQKLPDAGAATPESTSATLSPAARLISQLVGEPSSGAPKTTKSLPLTVEASLLNTPPSSGQALAPALQRAVTTSGLFYEAHQAQWVNGADTLTDLLAEPQNRLSAGSGTSPLTTPRADTSQSQNLSTDAPREATSPRPVTAGTSPNNTTMPPPQGPQSDGLAGKEGLASTTTPALQLSRELTPFVQQQLQLLTHGSQIWQGQVWPGQEMEWEIIDEEARRQGGDPDAGQGAQWRTRLRLQLPELGEIVADLRLNTHQVDIRLTAPTAAVTLRNNTADLQSKLALAGMVQGALSVDAHD